MTYGLNLLPRDLKETVAYEDAFSRWRTGMILLVGVAIIALASLAALEWSLHLRANDLAQQIQQARAISNQPGTVDVATATAKINTTIATFQSILPAGRSWSATINKILAVIPGTIHLSSLDISGAGQVTLKGVAETRTVFLAFQTTLATSPVLLNATTHDLASLRKDLPFTYMATLAPGL